MSAQGVGLAFAIFALLGSLIYAIITALDVRKRARRRSRVLSDALMRQLEPLQTARLGYGDSLSDEAITRPDQDELDRTKFAESIAAFVASRPVGTAAFTIAIDGEWGSGKSSVLNLAEIAARREYSVDVVVARFDPWEFSQSNDIISQLFVRIAIALLASASREDAPIKRNALGTAGSLYLKLASASSPRERRRDAARVIQAMLSGLGLAADESVEDDLSFYRHALGSLSNKALPYKILVIIDDVDRLLPSEILQVFQAIKAIGDFPNLVYLLAMDHRVVRAAVQRELGLDDPTYVEKIVQLPVSLPFPRREAIDRMFLSRLEAIQSNGFAVDLTSEYFLSAYASAVRAHLRTPRDVRRVLIGIEVLALRIGAEVNSVDLVLLSVLQTLYPDLYSALPEYQDVLVGPTHIFFNVRRDAIEKGIDELVAYADLSRRAAVRNLLLFLFPFVSAALESKNSLTDGPSEGIRVTWRHERRVSEPVHFALAFGIPNPSEVSHGEIVQAFERIETERELRDRLLQIAGTPRASAFLARLSEDLDSLPRQILPLLAVAIVDLGDAFPVGRDQAGFIDNAMRISWLIEALLKRVGHELSLSDVVKKASHSLYVPAYVLAMLGVQHNENNDASDVHPENRAAAYLLANRISAAIASGGLFTDPAITARGGAIFLMARFKDWAGEAESRTVIQRALQSDSVLYEFARTALSFGAGIAVSEVKAAAATMVGAEYLYTRLDDLLSSSLGATLEDYERRLITELRDWFRLRWLESRGKPDSGQVNNNDK